MVVYAVKTNSFKIGLDCKFIIQIDIPKILGIFSLEQMIKFKTLLYLT